MSKKEVNNNTNNDDIEVVIGDDSILNISEVGDCMNDLRPKDSVKNKKKVIIPVAKKKKGDNKKEDN